MRFAFFVPVFVLALGVFASFSSFAVPDGPKQSSLPADMMPAFALELDNQLIEGAATYKGLVTAYSASSLRMLTLAWSEGQKRHKPGRSVHFLHRLPEGKRIPLDAGDQITLTKTPLFHHGRTGYLWTIHKDEELVFAAQLYGREQSLSFELPLTDGSNGSVNPILEQRTDVSAREFWGESPYASEFRIASILRAADRLVWVKEGESVLFAWNSRNYELTLTESRYSEPLAGHGRSHEGTRYALGYLLLRAGE